MVASIPHVSPHLEAPKPKAKGVTPPPKRDYVMEEFGVISGIPDDYQF
jgi:hypothetical protein